MKVIVIFETTRGRTKAMAEVICEGVQSTGKECELVDAKDFSSIDGACAIAVGSSTRMKRTLPKVKQILSELPSLEGIPGAAFGSYGWSGEAPDVIAAELERLGVKLIDGQPLKVKDYPNDEMLVLCKDLGRALANACA